MIKERHTVQTRATQRLEQLQQQLAKLSLGAEAGGLPASSPGVT